MSYTVMSKSAIEYLCKCINLTANVSDIINDIQLTSNQTMSSVKVDKLIKQCLQDANDYSDQVVSALTHLVAEKIDFEPTLDNTADKLNTLLLYSKNSDNNYTQYLRLTNELLNLGNTSLSLDEYLKISDADIKYVLKTSYDDLVTKVNEIDNTIGTETLATTAQTIKGAINELLVSGGGNVYTSTPIGTVLSFAGQTPPNGYLLCDGGSYAVADYQDLYDIIGNTYGGDSTNFNVPNLVNKFVQGSDISGTEMSAGLPNITGGTRDNLICYQDSISAGAIRLNVDKNYSTANITNTGSTNTRTTVLGFDASLSNSIYGNSDTVQPPALTMVYIIKAFHTNEGVDSSVELEDNVVNHINNRIENKVNEVVEKTVDNVVVKKTDIVTTIDSSSTDDKVPSAKAVNNVVNHINNRIENKVNEVVKKTDIVTTIDSSSTDDKVPSAKAVNDILSTIKSVADVPKTTITPVFPSGVIVDSGGVAINYIVRNGWCSVNFAFNIASTTAFSWTDIATGLPKPANSVNIVLMNEGGKMNRPIAIKINSTGSVSSRIPAEHSTADWWAGNISYPVAE